jgi:hypothetical protein
VSVPVTFEDVQVPAFPVVVSVSVITPDFAVAAPPGVTVQVLSVSADDEVTPSPLARTAVAAVRAAAAMRLRMGGSPL